MAITTSSGVPKSFRAGNTVLFADSFTDYSAANSWTLKTVFIKSGEDPIEVDGVADGSGFDSELTATTSAKFSLGRWDWFSQVTLIGTGTTTADSGSVAVYANPLAPPEPTFEEEALAMIEKSLRGDLPTGQESYHVDGIDITKASFQAREELRNVYTAKVNTQRRQRRLVQGENVENGTQICFSS